MAWARVELLGGEPRSASPWSAPSAVTGGTALRQGWLAPGHRLQQDTLGPWLTLTAGGGLRSEVT